MRVTTKGQVTIPQEVRERLGITPGSEVEFRVEGKAARMTPTKNSAKGERDFVERMIGKATVDMTTDEIMALTRGKL